MALALALALALAAPLGSPTPTKQTGGQAAVSASTSLPEDLVRCTCMRVLLGARVLTCCCVAPPPLPGRFYTHCRRGGRVACAGAAEQNQGFWGCLAHVWNPGQRFERVPPSRH